MDVRQAHKGNKMASTSLVAAKAVDVNQQESSPPQAESQYLGKDVLSGLSQVAPTRKSNLRARQCLQELQSMVRRLGHDWDVQAFGSYANGFGTRFSDLDVTCCQAGQAPADETWQAAVVLGEWILPMVRERCSRFTVVEEILGARVPILKLRFDDSLDVDLSCHNPKPVLNTRLLKAYSRMDTRVRDLGIAIKLWARGAGVCDATKSNLSSYAFTLLALYFLQVHPDVRLPNLPAEVIAELGEQEACARATALVSRWRCELSLEELMSRFFAFYANIEPEGFAWGSEVVSVRCGCRRGACDSIFGNLRGRHTRRLHIEDPYQTERNLHCVLGEIEEEQLRAAFCEASHATQVNRRKVPDLADLIRVYQAANATDSGTDSTKSGGTVHAAFSGSDDESSAESPWSPPVGNIPLPLGLLKPSRVMLEQSA